MPTTVASLIIFVAFLLPGFTFMRRAEPDSPEREWTPLRELLSVLFVGVSCDLASVGVLAALWSLLPGLGPDFDQLVRMPARYLPEHYKEIVGWAAALIAIAIAIAFVAATSRIRWAMRRFSRRRGVEAQESAWWRLFHEHPGTLIYVGCFLEDGSYLRGRLHTYSRVSKEGPDRELTLRADGQVGISYRAPGAGELHELVNVGAVTLSARRILLMTVTYIADNPVQRL